MTFLRKNGLSSYTVGPHFAKPPLQPLYQTPPDLQIIRSRWTRKAKGSFREELLAAHFADLRLGELGRQKRAVRAFYQHIRVRAAKPRRVTNLVPVFSSFRFVPFSQIFFPSISSVSKFHTRVHMFHTRLWKKHMTPVGWQRRRRGSARRPAGFPRKNRPRTPTLRDPSPRAPARVPWFVLRIRR